MLTLRRLLRSRSELNSGTAHIFWYMMDELHPIDAIVKNNGNIPRQIKPKHLEHT